MSIRLEYSSDVVRVTLVYGDTLTWGGQGIEVAVHR